MTTGHARTLIATLLSYLVGTAVGVAALVVIASGAHAELLIKNATLSEGTVSVSGSTTKNTQILWGHPPGAPAVTTSNKQGKFGFSTQVVPADCVGTVSDGTEVVDVLISGCAPDSPPPATAFPATGQTQCYVGDDNTRTACEDVTTSQDGKARAGAELSYTDNGNGTITDNNTGLMWERKLAVNDAQGKCSDLEQANRSPRCVNNRYVWPEAFTTFIAALNTEPCFADHCDWRLPNVKELQSIVDYGRIIPTIDPRFGPTAEDDHWSSTSYVNSVTGAWCVDFFDGFVVAGAKLNGKVVRAVRGGS